MNDSTNGVKVQFRPRGLTHRLFARTRTGSINEIARRDLERYYNLIEAVLGTVELTSAEAALLCDALRTFRLDRADVALLWTEVADAIHVEGLDHRWAVDGGALVTKLRRLHLAQAYAVVDAVDRYWALASGSHDGAVDANLARVGLTR
jgi:hypothetical protein